MHIWKRLSPRQNWQQFPSLPPFLRCTGSADGRTDATDGQTGEHFAAAAAVHVPTRSDDDSVPRPSVHRRKGRRTIAVFSPSPMMIHPSTRSQIQTSHETFSSLERDVHFYHLPKVETCEVHATLSFGVFLVCTLVGSAQG